MPKHHLEKFILKHHLSLAETLNLVHQILISHHAFDHSLALPSLPWKQFQFLNANLLVKPLVIPQILVRGLPQRNYQMTLLNQQQQSQNDVVGSIQADQAYLCSSSALHPGGQTWKQINLHHLQQCCYPSL
jgi:hypothetical protein